MIYLWSRGNDTAALPGAVSGILDLPEGQEVVVIGTAYKEMKLKVRARTLVPPPLRCLLLSQWPAVHVVRHHLP